MDITYCCIGHTSPCTGTRFIQNIYAPSSSLLQGKYLPCSPSPFSLNIFRLFVILSLTQLYRYPPEIFLLSTTTFKYTYRAPLRRIGQEYSANVAWSTFQSLKRIQPLPVQSKNKTDLHDIAEILLKVALDIIPPFRCCQEGLIK
jgi:hypothetical protein